MLEKTLIKLGFSKQEALVYSVLLNNSPAGATLIANKCNMSRSSVYTILDRLILKGVVSISYENEVKQFIAHGYSILRDRLEKEKDKIEKKFDILESVKDNLQILTGNRINIPNIIFFEGQDGLKKIYGSMMRHAPQNAQMYILRDEFVWEDSWDFIFNKNWHDRVKKLKVEKNITTKLLINNSKTEKSKQDFYKSKKGLSVRYLPTKNSVKQYALYILGDTVSILSMENNNFVGIRIVNKHLAVNFKQVFEVLWGKSK